MSRRRREFLQKLHSYATFAGTGRITILSTGKQGSKKV